MRTLVRLFGWPVLAIVAVLGPVATFAIVDAPAAMATGVNHNQWEDNGSYAMGGAGSTGTAVNEVNHPGRNYFFTVTGVDSNGNPFGFLKSTEFGAIVSSNAQCTFVTMKSSEQSDGTVITLIATAQGHKWAFRFCNGEVIGGRNNGSQLQVVPPSQGGFFKVWDTVN